MLEKEQKRKRTKVEKMATETCLLSRWHNFSTLRASTGAEEPQHRVSLCSNFRSQAGNIRSVLVGHLHLKAQESSTRQRLSPAMSLSRSVRLRVRGAAATLNRQQELHRGTSPAAQPQPGWMGIGPTGATKSACDLMNRFIWQNFRCWPCCGCYNLHFL